MARHEASIPPSAESALDALLVTEREIAADQRRVAEECAAVVAAARDEAAALERDGAASVEREVSDLRAAAARDRDAVREARERATAQSITRYERLDDLEVLALAEFVAARVTGLTMTHGQERGP